MPAILEAPASQAAATPPQLWFETPPSAAATETLAASPGPLPVLPKPRSTATTPHEVAAPRQNIRTSVFAAEGKARSPWSGPLGAPAAIAPEFGQAPVDLAPATPQTSPEGIDGVRKLLFGHHLTEIQSKVAEVQLSLNGEMRRARESVMARVDEMAALLHRDMVVLREEMRAEITQLKADLFTAATGLSSVRDRVNDVEVKLCGETSAALAELAAGLESKEAKFDQALAALEDRLRNTVESKTAEAMKMLAKKSEVADALAQLSERVLEDAAPVEAKEPASQVWFAPQVRKTAALRPHSGLIGGDEELAPNTIHDWASMPNPFVTERAVET